MTSRAGTTGRDTLDAAVAAWIATNCKGSVVDYLIDSGAVLLIDPADSALIGRVRQRYPLVADGLVRAVLGAVFGDQ